MRLAEIAAQMPVWIVDTQTNREMAEHYWSRHPERTSAEGVTTFKANTALPVEQWFSDVLLNVDLHHGKLSHDPAYSAVEVFGATLTPGLRAIFSEFGFGRFSEHAGGFSATRGEAGV